MSERLMSDEQLRGWTEDSSPALRHCATELLALRARVAKLEEATVDAAASLAAAISLLERGGKKAAPSDKMFEQMLVDYRNSLERARAALKDTPQ